VRGEIQRASATFKIVNAPQVVLKFAEGKAAVELHHMP